MNTDTHLLKVLLAIAAASFLALVAGSATVMLLGQQENRIFSLAAMAIAAVNYFSLLALWIYWIVRLCRNSKTTELLLCFVIPYIYAVYLTIKVLRNPQALSAPSSAASGGA